MALPDKLIMDSPLVKLVSRLRKRKGYAHLQYHYLTIPPKYLGELTKRDDKKKFKRLVDAYVEYVVRVNPRMPEREVRMEALDYMEFLCQQADRGKVVIGLPMQPLPRSQEKVRNLFRELYKEQLARNNNYTLTHKFEM